MTAKSAARQRIAGSGTGAVKRPSVAIVVPAYNEAPLLAASLATLYGYLTGLDAAYDWHVIVVDDGSSDGTDRIADDFAVAHDRLTVLHHPQNLGLGGALRTGFRASTSDYVVVMDSDLTYAPEHIRLLLDEIIDTGAAIVVASPYRKGAQATGIPLSRLLPSRTVNLVLALTSGLGISTCTGMVRAYDGPFVRSLHLTSNDATINGEALYRARCQNAVVVEIPAHLDWSRLPVERQHRASARKLMRTGLSTLALASRFLLLRARRK
jgi:glycosyltransferase involved in cell wall biosynthesis